MQVSVSISICCHNSVLRLPDTLSHLARQKVDGGVQWEVLVIDNGSVDQTAKVAVASWPPYAAAPLRVISEPRLGVQFARHRACQEAAHEIVCFVDDDNWVCDHWVQTVARIMSAHPEVGALGARIEPAFEAPPPPWMGELIRNFAVGDQANEDGDVTDTVGRLWTAGMSLRRAAWNGLISCGFSFLSTSRTGKALGSGEDSELCYALRMAGWRLHYSNQLSLRHYIPSGRLRWDYLQRLYLGFGVSQVILDIYELNLGSATTKARPYLIKIMSMAWRAAKLIPKVLKTSDRRREGNEDYLRFLFCSGYINRLWEARTEYRDLRKKIGTLGRRLRSQGDTQESRP
jgi:glycosyltransferase involved in cell wall biosynthesis